MNICNVLYFFKRTKSERKKAYAKYEAGTLDAVKDFGKPYEELVSENLWAFFDATHPRFQHVKGQYDSIEVKYLLLNYNQNKNENFC